jgi:L-serine dehydratase
MVSCDPKRPSGWRQILLAGFDQVIPLDEVIAAMDAVGRSIPCELRCTALGGLSVSQTSKAIEKRLKASG